jgi:hypothetical protein
MLMTNSIRRDLIRLFAFGMLLLLPSTSWAQQRPPIAEQMAKAYGIDSFGKIEGIRFTFNVERTGFKLSRAWEWQPKTDTVTFQGKVKTGKLVKVTYPRSQLGSQSDVIKSQIDPAFINDEYWLLLPFHVIWDGSATVADVGMHKLPLGGGSAELVVMKYPSQGGYAPGDTWELYVGADKRIEQMVYRSPKPRVVIMTWTGYKQAGPLLVSTEHRGTADGKPARIFFSDVSVRVAGSENWINAQ